MKKKQYFCISLCMLVSTLFYWSCTDSEFVSKDTLIQNEEFSLQEAKEFFEKQIEQCPVTNRSAKGRKYNQASPGEFVPKWGQAIASSLKYLSSYDVPIQAGFRYKAIRSEYQNGKAFAYIVDVYQKLIIVKDAETDALGQYILTLIPDRSYHARYKNEVGERFINCADKGQFSGIAVYTMPHLDIVIRANRYVNGVKTKGVFWPNKNQALKQKLKTLESILKGTVLKRRAAYSTRSFGEDDWDFGTEGEDYWPVGDGLFYDPDNETWLIDFDGDGEPDSAYIPEIEITPEGPWDDSFPDPDPDWDGNEENVCPYCGSAGCLGECMDNGPSFPDPIEPEPTPCIDYENKKSVPMLQMELAPPSPANPLGATFGMTRFNGTKMHSGIDLKGEVGDPVYAVHGGTITRIVSEQVDRVSNRYPDGYNGDKNAAGNRIYITFSTGVEDAYFHLQAGEPVAVNPHTGELFKVGDRVEMGDIIGYVGVTGNANPKVPHLHFGVRVNGKWKDPFDYINAILQNENDELSISTPCDK
mgnify:CR=1 FL=1